MESEFSLTGIPMTILATVGFLPLSTLSGKSFTWPRQDVLNKASLYISSMFVLGAALNGAINISRLVSHAIAEPNTEHTSPLFHALSEVYDGILPFESVCVLCIFLLKRKPWNNMQISLREIVDTSKVGIKKQAVWRRTGNILSGMTLLLIVLWEYAEWRSYWDQNPEFYAPDFANAFTPLPIKVTAIQDLTIWIVFSTLPHLFTQQVYICIIITAVVLRDVSDEFLVKINEINQLLADARNAKIVTALVREMQAIQLQLMRCMDSVNGVCSWILLIVFKCNLILACSFLTANVAAPPKVVTGSILYCYSAVIFFSYAVLFAIPLVQLYEKANKFAVRLYELGLEIESSTIADIAMGNHLTLVNAVRALEKRSRDFAPCFTAGGILYYTRGLLTAACTFLVSAGLLIQEVASNYARTLPDRLCVDNCHTCCSYNNTS